MIRPYCKLTSRYTGAYRPYLDDPSSFSRLIARFSDRPQSQAVFKLLSVTAALPALTWTTRRASAA